MLTSNKLTLTASDSGFEAIESSGTLVGTKMHLFSSKSHGGITSYDQKTKKVPRLLTPRLLKFERTDPTSTKKTRT